MIKNNKLREEFEKINGYDVYAYFQDRSWHNPEIIGFCENYVEFLENKILNKEKDFFGNVWIKADKDVREYPIGTKFKALMGGYWIRTERGFKWCTGSTFPNVGGDWTGEVCLP